MSRGCTSQTYRATQMFLELHGGLQWWWWWWCRHDHGATAWHLPDRYVYLGLRWPWPGRYKMRKIFIDGTHLFLLSIVFLFFCFDFPPLLHKDRRIILSQSYKSLIFTIILYFHQMCDVSCHFYRFIYF